MKNKALQDLLDRVTTWPKEAQRAAFDSLSAIEEERYGDPAMIEEIIRRRDDAR